VSDARSFAELALAPDATMDLLALALAAEFRDVDAHGALAKLDALGAELARAAARSSSDPAGVALACGHLLGADHGFDGDRGGYDDPDNSMLDLVLTRRRGLPILLSVVYIEVARRAGIPLRGIGLPGHFVVAHFGADPPVLLDPFDRGRVLNGPVANDLLRPWQPHEIAMRMLNNLVAAFERRSNLGAAIRAASMRLSLPAQGSLRTTLQAELRSFQARLN
jgi:regulator of sirC expression with transglutaminase-like and TPR domain